MQLSLPKQIRSMKIKIYYWENNKLILLNASFELVLFFFIQIPLQTYPSINLLIGQSSLIALSTLENISIETTLYT